MSTLEERQVAAADLESTLTDWFPDLDALMVHQIATLAIAAYDRAMGDLVLVAELKAMLRHCENHCSDGFVAERARALLERLDGSEDAQ